MAAPSASTRFDAALRAVDVDGALIALARALKTEGMSQREMYDLYCDKLGEHIDDPDETIYDKIFNVIPSITGNVAPDWRIFETRM